MFAYVNCVHSASDLMLPMRSYIIYGVVFFKPNKPILWGKKIKFITDKGTWQFEWMSFNIYIVISGSTLGYTSITTVDITTRQKSIFRLLTNGDCKVILGSFNELNHLSHFEVVYKVKRLGF